MMDASFEERRAALVQLLLRPPTAVVAETFTDGPALFDAVCRLGLEGVVAKRLSSRYRTNQRGWVKTKNPKYCRDSERKAMERSRKRRPRAFV
jgi:bifunctional non-homologous end joining protein LigD